MTGGCPHCGAAISFYADMKGNTIVVNAEKKEYVVVYGSGFCKKNTGYEVHTCGATGKDGHIVK